MVCLEKEQMALYGNMTVAELAETILSEQREGVEAVGRAVPLTKAHIVEIVRHIDGATTCSDPTLRGSLVEFCR